MRSKRSCLIGIVALVTPLVVASGCTGGDPLNPSTNTLTLAIETVNTSSRFDGAFFVIRQITVTPVDPQAQTALGVTPLGLVGGTSALELNMNVAGSQFDIPSALGNGSYRVDSMTVGRFDYRDFDPPASTATCEEFVSTYAIDPAQDIFLSSFGNPVFTVSNARENRLTITVDGQQLLAAYQASFFCVQQGFQGCPRAWCLLPVGGLPFFDPSILNIESSNFLDFDFQ